MCFLRVAMVSQTVLNGFPHATNQYGRQVTGLYRERRDNRVGPREWETGDRRTDGRMWLLRTQATTVVPLVGSLSQLLIYAPCPPGPVERIHEGRVVGGGKCLGLSFITDGAL